MELVTINIFGVEVTLQSDKKNLKQLMQLATTQAQAILNKKQTKKILFDLKNNACGIDVDTNKDLDEEFAGQIPKKAVGHRDLYQ